MNYPIEHKRYVALVCDTYFSASELALLSPQDGKVMVLSRALGSVLEQCAVPRSPAEHVAHVSRALAVPAADAAGALRALAAVDLLIEYPSARGAPRRATSTGRRIDTLGLVTADRPNELRRALSSYRRNWRKYDRQLRVIVVDGSRNNENAASAGEALGKTADDGTPVTVVGSRQRRQLRVAAEAAGFPPDVIGWALPDPPASYAAGAVRNLLTLATAGGPLISLDDDTLCSLRSLPWHEDGLAFVGHGDPRETIWFETRQESINAGQSIDADVVGLHEALLGQDLRLLQQRSESPCDLERACKHLAVTLQGGRTGRLRATWFGIAGDGAQYCPHANLFASGATRERMASHERAFRLALTSREVARAVRRTTVTDEAAFMMYCAGLDNSEMLPPFNPLGFNEDGLFGALLRLCDRSAYIAEIPVAVVHDSARLPLYEPQTPRSASRIRLTDVILGMIRAWASACVSQSPDERLKDVGRHLRAWSELETAEFAWQLKRLALDLKWQLVNRCEGVAASGFPYPEYWRQALAEYRTAVYNSLADPRFYMPVEYASQSAHDERLEEVREHVGMFGRLLLIWPDLWKWCANRKDWLH